MNNDDDSELAEYIIDRLMMTPANLDCPICGYPVVLEPASGGVAYLKCDNCGMEGEITITIGEA